MGRISWAWNFGSTHSRGCDHSATVQETPTGWALLAAATLTNRQTRNLLWNIPAATHKRNTKGAYTKGIGLHKRYWLTQKVLAYTKGIGLHKRYWLTQKVLAYTKGIGLHGLGDCAPHFFSLIYTSFDGSIRTTLIFVFGDRGLRTLRELFHCASTRPKNVDLINSVAQHSSTFTRLTMRGRR